MSNEEVKYPLTEFLKHTNVKIADIFLSTLTQLEEKISHSPLSLYQYGKLITALEQCAQGLRPEELQEHACRVLNVMMAVFSNNLEFSTPEQRFDALLLSGMGSLCRAVLESFCQGSRIAGTIDPQLELRVYAGTKQINQFLAGIERVLVLYYNHRKVNACEMSPDWTDATVEPFLKVFYKSICSSSLSLQMIEKAGDTSVVDSIGALFAGLAKLLETVSQRMCHFICSSILPHFLTPESSSVRLQVLWDVVCKFSSTDSATTYCGNKNLAFVILCSFSMPFVGGGIGLSSASLHPTDLCSLALDIRGKKVFWNLIQDGLMERDPLNRKRSMFLLQHCITSASNAVITASAIFSPGGVFWWDQTKGAELQQVWNDFLLMIETLEEKQVHIVKPVKPRLANLLAAVNTKIKGHSLLHFSWLGIVWKRIFTHDARNIVKWGVRSCLSVKLEPESPILEKENWNFIFGPLFAVLSQAPVLARDPDLPYGSCPTIVNLLKSFVAKVVEYTTFEEKKEFLMMFLRECKHQVLADIPLCYFSEALAALPSQPLLDSEGFLLLRVILSSSLLTHQVVLRSAVQYFFLETALHLVDLQSVGYNDVAMFFGSLKSSECLAFGSSSWKTATTLLSSVAVTQKEVRGASLLEYLSTGLYTTLSARQHTDNTMKDVSLSVSNLARLSLLVMSLIAEDETVLKDVVPGTPSPNLVPATSSPGAIVGHLVRPVLEVITQATSRPYLSAAVVLHAVEFLSALLGDLRSGENVVDLSSKPSSTEHLLLQCMEDHAGELVESLVRLIVTATKEPPVPDLAQVNLFMSLWKNLDWIFSRSQSSSIHLSLFVNTVVSKTDEVFSAINLSKPIPLSCDMMGVVCLLGWVCHKLWELNETRVTSGASFDTVSLDLRKQVCKVVLRVDVHPKFIKPAYPQVEQPTGTPGMLPNAAQPSMQLWGQVVSTALCSLWNCYRFVLRQSRAVGERALGVSVNVPDVFAQLTDCMDSAQLDMNVVLDCLTSTVPEMLEHNSSRLLDFISKCWSLVLSLKDHHKELWIAVKSFVKFAFHPLLLMPSEELREEVQPLLTNLNDEIYELGESKSGYCNLLMEHCCEEWLEAARSSEDTAAKRLSSSLSDYMDVIISACMFGPVGKRSQKAVDDVEAHIAALEASCGTNQLKLMYRHGDSNVRVTVISFLFELIAQSQGIRPSSWITDVFLVQLMKTMVEKSLAMSRSKPRYYLNSLPHRQKTRLWQAILTLVHFINKDASAHLVPLLFESLDFDNQLSVKHMIEWVATILLLCTPSLLPSLVDRLAYKEVKTRLACLPSFISIGCHLFTAVKNKEEQVSFCRQFLQVLLQWTQGQHVVSRLYAQAALLRTWDQMKETDCLAPVAEEFAVLDSVVEFSREYSDVVKFQHKLQSNVFFTLIDEYKDWNLETIFYCLPLLTSVIASEFVAVDEFLAVSSFWTKQDVLPLRCKRPEVLVKCKECESATGVAGDGEDEGDGEGDVQKKIVPWSGPEALHELFPNHVVVEGGRNDLEKSIILVSSLVNKPANLGGLSRTCEIFGVTELVIGNKNILEDALFQALSVTSERWLNITEVRVPELSGYLLAAKQQGYTLVGVEQTANSKCLTSYNFPRKTLLLLGNEREGIPVDLIHHLEECVEIPQLGLVRSLNVHVSGALMVWEFAKQHLIGQD